MTSDSPNSIENQETIETSLIVPLAWRKQTWEMGRDDGKIGQPSESGHAIQEPQASLDWQQFIAAKVEQLGREEANELIWQAYRTRLNAKLYNANMYHDKLRKQLNRQPYDTKLSSRFTGIALGVVYLVIAVILMFADFPLSKQVITDGFDFINNDFGVYILTVGLCLSSVFIKYFIDEMFYSEETTRWRRAILITVLVFFLSATVVFGVFRNISFSEEQQRETQIGEKTKSGDQASETTGSATTKSGRAGDGTAKDVKARDGADGAETADGTSKGSDKKNLLMSDENWNSLAFILLTLLFPIIGGICFSAGIREIKCWLSERSCLRLEEECQIAERMWFYSERKVAKMREIVGQLQSVEYKKLFIQLYEKTYNHGYERGLEEPTSGDQSNGFYAQCDRVIRRLMTQRLRDTKEIPRPGC